jgi:hypothetical protein
MRLTIALLAATALCTASLAQDAAAPAAEAAPALDITPLDMKTGEWEMTTEMMVKMPEEMMAGMTPEQKAEASKPQTNSSKDCIDDLTMSEITSSMSQDGCAPEVVESTASKLSLKIVCKDAAAGGGEFTIEAVSQTEMKGTMKMAMSGVSMEGTVSGKHVSDTCSTPTPQ